MLCETLPEVPRPRESIDLGRKTVGIHASFPEHGKEIIVAEKEKIEYKNSYIYPN